MLKFWLVVYIFTPDGVFWEKYVDESGYSTMAECKVAAGKYTTKNLVGEPNSAKFICLAGVEGPTYLPGQ